MNLLRQFIRPLLLASLGLIALATMIPAQVTSGEKNSPVADAPSTNDAAALQKKANEAQARIHGNKDDRDQLKRAVKLNEVGSAKEVLLRNGFTDGRFGKCEDYSTDRWRKGRRERTRDLCHLL